MSNFDKMIKNIMGSPKKIGGRNDWDGDGVPNRKDCQPRNTMRQDRNYGSYLEQHETEKYKPIEYFLQKHSKQRYNKTYSQLVGEEKTIVDSLANLSMASKSLPIRRWSKQQIKQGGTYVNILEDSAQQLFNKRYNELTKQEQIEAQKHYKSRLAKRQ